MKKTFKSFVDAFLALIGYKLVKNKEGIEELHNSDQDCKPSQVLLSMQYRNILAQKMPLPKLADVGFRVYSQTDEDGIILFLFSVIGATNKIFVEIGTGNGVECNCANLAINFGWHGLFIDGDSKAIASGIKFYGSHPDTKIFPPKFLSAMVNSDDINDLISNAGFCGEIDFLSIDIDGMDYWIWETINCVNPRVVVVEANGKFGMRSITVPYDDKWVYDANATPHYHGASLTAFTKLANKKGYRLVGTNRFGYNAFYIRNDIAKEILPAVSVESCRTHPTRENDKKIFQKISHLPFIEV